MKNTPPQDVSTKKRDMAAVVADGVYVPPAKRRAMEERRVETTEQRRDTDADSIATQRRTWEEQKRVVHGTTNRLNSATIKPLIHDLFELGFNQMKVVKQPFCCRRNVLPTLRNGGYIVMRISERSDILLNAGRN